MVPKTRFEKPENNSTHVQQHYVRRICADVCGCVCVLSCVNDVNAFWILFYPDSKSIRFRKRQRERVREASSCWTMGLLAAMRFELGGIFRC